MSSKKKADCTPEEWAVHLEKARGSMRRSLAKPEVRERHRARQRARYAAKAEEMKAQKREQYRANPEVKKKAREYQREKYNTDPAFRARARASQKKVRSTERHKATVRVRELARQREKRTGATPEVVGALLVLQGGKCAVCGGAFTRTPHVDHCHEAGTPRGLLCSSCNAIEGFIKKVGVPPEEYGRRLQSYLDNPPALTAQAAVDLAG